jgi:hypothetical protein
MGGLSLVPDSILTADAGAIQINKTSKDEGRAGRDERIKYASACLD